MKTEATIEEKEIKIMQTPLKILEECSLALDLSLALKILYPKNLAKTALYTLKVVVKLKIRCTLCEHLFDLIIDFHLAYSSSVSTVFLK